MRRLDIRTIHINQLVVVRDLNYREDYDLIPMEESIFHAGRILEPIHVLVGQKDFADFTVTRGNRRTLGGQAVYRKVCEELNSTIVIEPERRAQLEMVKKNLEAVEIIPYSDLTETEIQEAVLDHGSQKALTRTEVVKAVWRLQQQMYGERDIQNLLYFRLAEFTGYSDKAAKASAMPEGKERTKYLFDWLHGTVGNYLMPAGQMGLKVKDQVLLTEAKKERDLTEDEQKRWKFKTSRARISELTTAKNEDKETKNWEPEVGGPKFNALLAKFEAEDKEETGADGKKKRKDKPSVSDLATVADTMDSPMRLAFLQAAGILEESDRKKIVDADREFFRMQCILSALTINVERIGDEKVRDLVRSVIHGEPSAVEKALAPFLVAPTPPTPPAKEEEPPVVKEEEPKVKEEKPTIKEEATRNGPRRRNRQSA